MNQIAPAPATMPHGPLSTSMRLTTWFVPVSTRTTLSSPNRVAQAAPSTIATEHGWAPTLIFATTSTPLVDARAPATRASEATATRPTLRIHLHRRQSGGGGFDFALSDVELRLNDGGPPEPGGPPFGEREMDGAREKPCYSPSSGCDVTTVLTISQLTWTSDSFELSQTTSASPSPQSMWSTMRSRASACMRSLPAPPFSVSAPRPTQIRSSPLSPFTMSLPQRPRRTSSPSPPFNVSLPGPPRMRSLPPSPFRVSFPQPPNTRSNPSPALTTSSPPRAWMRSLPAVPVSVSPFLVPLMTTTRWATAALKSASAASATSARIPSRIVFFTAENLLGTLPRTIPCPREPPMRDSKGFRKRGGTPGSATSPLLPSGRLVRNLIGAGQAPAPAFVSWRL